MKALSSWLQYHQTLLVLSGAGSFLLLLATLALLMFFVARMPPDYFAKQPHPSLFKTPSGVPVPVIWFLKNLLGVVLILIGLVMVALPGQGLITILIGLILLNFPGKQWLETKIVRQPPVFKALNWLRKKTGHEPLLRP